jgi:hypothetical protein
MSEKSAPEKILPVFGPTLEQFESVVEPTEIINQILHKADNVIRPSVAFELIIKVIRYYLKTEVPEFINHELAWDETIGILKELGREVSETKEDRRRAMVLSEFEWKLADIFYWYGRMATTFDGNYRSYVGNRSSNSFGELTPAECLKLIYYVLYPCAPTSSWSYGPWKSQSSISRGMWDTWPWAEYVLGTIRRTYIDLEEVPFYIGPSGSGSGGSPWSAPKRW